MATSTIRLKTTSVPSIEPLAKIITPQAGEIFQKGSSMLYVGNTIELSESFSFASTDEVTDEFDKTKISPSDMFHYLPETIRKAKLYGFLLSMGSGTNSTGKTLDLIVKLFNLYGELPESIGSAETSLLAEFESSGAETSLVPSGNFFIPLARPEEIERGKTTFYFEHSTSYLLLSAATASTLTCTMTWKLVPLVGSNLTIPEVESQLTYM